MPKKPKNLAEYIVAAKAHINKAAFQAGQFLYGVNSSKRSDLPQSKLPPEETAKAENIESPSIAKFTPTAHNKKESEFTKELVRFERELATLRESYKQAHDDLDRNALHFRILRLERARQKFLDDNK